MPTIVLHKNRRPTDIIATVDDEDADLACYRWSYDRKGYAVCHQNTPWGDKVARMHRVILERKLGRALAPWPDEHVDHVNGNGYDNRRDNLRAATPLQNHMNRRSNRGSTSGYKGVSWCSQMRLWKAGIKIAGRNRHLGYHADEKAAALAYDEAALGLHGEFAFQNL